MSLARLAIISGVPSSTLERAIGDLDGDKSRTFYIGRVSVHQWVTARPARCALSPAADSLVPQADPAPVSQAHDLLWVFAFADHICRQWREYRQHDEEFRRRMRIFHGSSWEVPAAHPTIAAATYPQVVALTRLLITPHWKNLAIEFWHAEHPVFVRELHQTVAPGLCWPQPSFSKDPLHRWLIGGHRRTAFDLVTA